MPEVNETPEPIEPELSGEVCPYCETEMTQAEYEMSTNVDGEQWHEICANNQASYCNSCDNYTAHTTTVDGQIWCERCADNYALSCDVCDELTTMEDHCETARNEAIHSWGYKPEPIFHPAYPTDRTNVPRETLLQFGIELESEPRDSNKNGVDILVNNHNHNELYLKEDGSLSDDGVEIVTHPRSLQSWQSWGEFSATLHELRKEGWRAWDERQCGLHIHASRAGFENASHLMRLAYILRRNDYETGLVKFAGRRSDFARWDNMRNGTLRNLTRGWNAHHYDAISFAPSATVEFRIFRPAMRIGRILACVELTHAIIEYTRHMTAQETARSTWNMFTEWVHAQGEIYMAAQHVLRGGTFATSND